MSTTTTLTFDHVKPACWQVQITPDQDEIDRLLAEGWEPFSVYSTPYSHVVVALRKREQATTPAQSGDLDDPPPPPQAPRPKVPERREYSRKQSRQARQQT